MPPRTVHISQADADTAKYEFLNHPEPKVQVRMLCLRLKYRGYEHQLIADILEVSRNYNAPQKLPRDSRQKTLFSK